MKKAYASGSASPLPWLPPHIEVAQYQTELRQQRYAGNKLIEALPPSLSEEEIFESLQHLPPFDPASRQWPNHERVRELMTLTNMMVPLSSHIELGMYLDSVMREGYVGRRPFSPEHMAIYHEIHDDQRRGGGFRQTANTITPQLSAALIGVSGMGKTSAVKRMLARFPQVIYHPDIDLYQITWLHIEMPSDGKGVKSLLSAIIEAIAELIPNNTYFDDYVGKSRASESTMQSYVRRLMNKHCVGLLVADEVQNVSNTPKSKQVVMTELTTITNRPSTPVLLIGTPQADQVLGLNFRQSRRSYGMPLGNWNPLPKHDLNPETLSPEPGEWMAFMEAMWTYQWTRNPVELTQGICDLFYDYTQGIIDLAIKLFIGVQARAIFDGTERISEQLIAAVYEQQFAKLKPMIEALRCGDREALLRFDDIRNFSAQDVVDEMSRKARRKGLAAASSRPGKPDFKPRIVEAGKALGLPEKDAIHYAEEIEREGSAKDTLDAMVQLDKKTRAPSPVRSVKKKPSDGSGNETVPEYPGLDERVDDFRHAIVAAARKRTSIYQELVGLGMAPLADDVICLD